MFSLSRYFYVLRNKKTRDKERERERERERRPHLFEPHSTRTHIRAAVLFFPREEEEEEEEDQKRDFEQLREFCAFFGFSNRERERERERERDFGGVCLTERGDKNERNDDDG